MAGDADLLSLRDRDNKLSRPPEEIAGDGRKEQAEGRFSVGWNLVAGDADLLSLRDRDNKVSRPPEEIAGDGRKEQAEAALETGSALEKGSGALFQSENGS